MFASRKGHLEIVKLLIANKITDINIQNNNGVTALMFASQKGHLEIVKLLIEKGANVNAQSKSGWTTLMKGISKWSFRSS